MKDFYFEVLERLYNAGIGAEKEITDIFADVVHQPWYNKEVQIKDFLDAMQDNKHIKYTIVGGGVPNKDILNAEITILGYEYYRKHLLDLATITSFNNQRSYNYLAISTAIIAIIISVIALYLKSCETQTIILQTPIQKQRLTNQPRTYPTDKIVDTISEKK